MTNALPLLFCIACGIIVSWCWGGYSEIIAGRILGMTLHETKDRVIVFRLIGGPKDGHEERSDQPDKASHISRYMIMSQDGAVGRWIQVLATNPNRKTVPELMAGQSFYNYQVADRAEDESGITITCEFRQ